MQTNCDVTLMFRREKMNSTQFDRILSAQFKRVATTQLSVSDNTVYSSVERILRLIFNGGGFFLASGEDLDRMFDHSFPACAFFFFFKVEISSRTLIPLF